MQLSPFPEAQEIVSEFESGSEPGPMRHDGAALTVKNRIGARRSAQLYNRFVKRVLPQLALITREAASELVRDLKIDGRQNGSQSRFAVTLDDYIDLCVIMDRLREFGRHKGMEPEAREFIEELITELRRAHGFPTILIQAET